MKLFTGTVLGNTYSMTIERKGDRAEAEMLIADREGNVIDSISRMYDSRYMDNSDESVRESIKMEARDNIRDSRYG